VRVNHTFFSLGGKWCINIQYSVGQSYTNRWSNVNLYGPSSTDAEFENTTTYINGAGLLPNNQSLLGLYGAAIALSSNTAVNFKNANINGYPLNWEGTAATQENITFGTATVSFPTWTNGWCNFDPQNTVY